jgi:hypothetical protein
MRLRIHRALFGEKDGYHAILKASLPDSEVLSELRGRSDRPAHHLPGTNWQPFDRGIIVGSWYAVCRTFPDAGASRGGMVKTFALLAPLEQIGKLADLEKVMSHLPANIEQEWVPQSFELEVLEGRQPNLESALSPGVTNVLHSLFIRSDVRLPVAFVGQISSSGVISQLWNCLWPSMRRRFQFDLLFAPVDLERLNLTVAVILESSAASWPGPLVRASDPPPTTLTASENALIGASSGKPIAELFELLDTEPADFKAMQRAELCVRYLSNIAKLQAAEIHGLVGLIAALAPQATQGEDLKRNILGRWLAEKSTINASDVLALRNFPISAFVDGKSVAKDLAMSWLHSHLTEISSADETAQIVVQALSGEEYCQAWNEHILHETEATLTKSASAMAPILWRWWTKDWQLGVFTVQHLAVETKIENALLKTCPETLKQSIADPLLALTVARDWGCLHAAICARTLQPAAAFAKQVAIRHTERAKAGLEILADQFTAADTLQAARSTGDSRVIELASKDCVEQPTLFENLDFNRSSDRAILQEALRIEPDCWSNIPDRQQTVFRVLDQLIKGTAVEESILEFLASTIESNLFDYPHRSKIWPLVVPRIRDRFVASTAKGWISAFRRSPSTVTEPEKVLAEVAFSSACLEDLLSTKFASDLPIVLEAFEKFARLDEIIMSKWLESNTRIYGSPQFGPTQAQQLGKIIRERHWSEAAQILRKALSSRRDLAPAVRECLDLFGTIERFVLGFQLPGIQGPSREDFWEALELELINILPQGPMQEAFWDRAGGDDSVLNGKGSGRQQWHNATKLLRQGSGGKDFNVRKMLAKAKLDFPLNDKLDALDRYARDKHI